ncbi:MAG: hypothetical protein Ta2A_01840 [Treponemataceae bacterium]|nr:MAG: hypothetical protein Ta2A_01840 [Treponemataceae bacterium]
MKNDKEKMTKKITIILLITFLNHFCSAETDFATGSDGKTIERPLSLDISFLTTGLQNQQPRRKQRGMLFLPRNCTQARIPLFRRRAAGYAPLRHESGLGTWRKI